MPLTRVLHAYEATAVKRIPRTFVLPQVERPTNSVASQSNSTSLILRSPTPVVLRSVRSLSSGFCPLSSRLMPPQCRLQHLGNPVIVVGGAHLIHHVEDIWMRVGHAEGPACPGEHGQIVGHVAERKYVGWVDALRGTPLPQRGCLGHPPCADLCEP